MGVVSMTVHWYLPENSQMTDLYQFFYFDAEEDGFETYSSFLGGNSPEDYQNVIKAAVSYTPLEFQLQLILTAQSFIFG